MARIKIQDGGDRDVVLAYLAPITGSQQISASTNCTVALTTIGANDIVMTQTVSSSSLAATLVNTVITAGTGFACTFQAALSATLQYAVFHPNA